eukprot:g21568.t1
MDAQGAGQVPLSYFISWMFRTFEDHIEERGLALIGSGLPATLKHLALAFEFSWTECHISKEGFGKLVVGFPKDDTAEPGALEMLAKAMPPSLSKAVINFKDNDSFTDAGFCALIGGFPSSLKELSLNFDTNGRLSDWLGGTPEEASADYYGPGTGQVPETSELRKFKFHGSQEKWVVIKRESATAVFKVSSEVAPIRSSGVYVGMEVDTLRGSPSLLQELLGVDKVHLCRNEECSEPGHHFKIYGLTKKVDFEDFNLRKANTEARAWGARFRQKISARLAVGLAGPYWGTSDKFALSAADFVQVTDAELDAFASESRTTKQQSEQRPAPPTRLDDWVSRVTRQNQVWALTYGMEWLEVRQHALELLSGWHQELPHKWPLQIVMEAWEELHWRFIEEMKELLRQLKKTAKRESMSLSEIRFHALLPGPDGRAWLELPRTFDLLNPNGWFKVELEPRIERRQERALWRLTWGGDRKQGPGLHAGGGKENEEGRGGGKANPTMLGPKLTQEEVNRARDRAPVSKGGTLLCWGYLTHSGCSSTTCQRAHEGLRGTLEALDPAVQMQLIRRGGLKRMKPESQESAKEKIQQLRHATQKDKAAKMAKPKRKAGAEHEEQNDEAENTKAGGHPGVRFNDIPEEFEAVDYTKQEDVQDFVRPTKQCWGIPVPHQNRGYWPPPDFQPPEGAAKMVQEAEQLSQGPVLGLLQGASDDLYAWASARVAKDPNIQFEEPMGEMAAYGVADLANEAAAFMDKQGTTRAGENARLTVRDTMWVGGEAGQGCVELDGTTWRSWDYQEEVLMTEELAGILQIPEPVPEKRQCVTKTLAAGSLWREKGRRPSLEEAEREETEGPATDCAFDAGQKKVTVRQMQQFRGIMTGWGVVVKGLANELKAADIFLSADEGGLPANPRSLGYKDPQLEKENAWSDLWELFEVCRWLCARSDTWEDRFGTTLKELLPVKERLSLPNEWQDTIWVSSDATTTVIGAIDWSFKKAARAKVIDLEPWLKGVAEQEMQDDANMRVHISEMLSLVAFMCERGPDWKGKVVLYAGDNSTVRQWVCRRQSGLRAGKLLIRVINLCEMNYGFTLVGAWWRTYHNTDSDFITRCEDDEFGEFLEKKGWDNVSLGPAICQAIEDTDRFGPCFLSWKDPEDRRVMMQLKEKRMKRFIDRPVGIPWERLEVVELAVEDRWVKDFELLARQHVMDHVGEIKVVVATLPVDKKGKIVAEFNKQLTDQKPQIVVWEGPRNGPWEAAARGMIEVGLQPVQFEFVSTELGELLARRRTCLVATSFGASEDLAKRCLVRTVTAPPLGTCLQRAPHGLDLIWKKPCRLTIEPGIPRDPLLPQVVGHAWDVPEGERKNVHGLAGPGRWPLRKENGEFEKIEVYDRLAAWLSKTGGLRKLQFISNSTHQVSKQGLQELCSSLPSLRQLRLEFQSSDAPELCDQFVVKDESIAFVKDKVS